MCWMIRDGFSEAAAWQESGDNGVLPLSPSGALLMEGDCAPVSPQPTAGRAGEGGSLTSVPAAHP